MKMKDLKALLRRTVVDDYKGVVNSLSSAIYMLKRYKWKRDHVPVTSPLVIFNVGDCFIQEGWQPENL